MMRNYLFIASIMLFLAACGGKEEVKEEVLRPVRYQVVGTSNHESTRTLSGIAKAGNEIELSFRSSGILTDVSVKVGERVKKGDLLAKLDNIEANLAYEKSVSALKSAESDINKASTDLERIKGLYEKNSVSLSDYQSAKNVYQNALSQYESAKRNKSIQQTQVAYGFIYAPKDGVIADTEGKVNENIKAGHVFAILNAGDQMEIEIGVPENTINRLQLGMSVDVVFSALAGQTFKGEVIEVPPIVDKDAATYTVSIAITSPTGAIKAGMAAKVTFTFGNGSEVAKDELVVPLKAVGEDGEGNFVFIVEATDESTGVVKRQTVELGGLTAEGFQIKSGLTEGQMVATAGLQTLLDGQKVRLQ